MLVTKPPHAFYTGAYLTGTMFIFWLYLDAMPGTNSSLNCIFGASLGVTTFHDGAMPDANSSINGILRTPLMALRLLYFGAAVNDAKSFPNDLVGAAHVTAMHCTLCTTMLPAQPSPYRMVFVATLVTATHRTLCAMTPTQPLPYGVFVATLVAAWVKKLRAMLGAKSTPNDIFGTTLVTAALALCFCAVPDANSTLYGLVGGHLTWPQRFTKAPCMMETPILVT